MTIICGIEGRHAWTPPGASEPAVTLNEVLDDLGAQVFPRVKINSVLGLMGLGSPENYQDVAVGRPGTIPRPSFRRGKTVTYEGEVEAKSLLELRLFEADLRAAFADEESEGRMDVSPHPLNEELAGEADKFYTARALGLDIPDSQDTEDFVRTFTLSLELSDARYFDENGDTQTAAIVQSMTKVAFA